jgi:hypothetical protein
MARLMKRVSLLVVVFALTLSGCEDLLVKQEVAQRIQDYEDWLAFAYGQKTILSGPCYAASLGVNGSKLYVLYFDLDAQRIRIIKSADGGANWGSPFNVDNTNGIYSTSNNLVVDGSDIYVTYQRSDTVYFRQVTDTGSSFSLSNLATISTLSGYPYGYENSIACDSSNVYVLYTAGAGPAYSFAAKGASMSFSAPVFIDSDLTQYSGNRKRISTYIDSGGELNACYFDDVNDQLKIANFACNDTLPMTVSPINVSGSYITAAGYPSCYVWSGSLRFVAYYNTSAQNLSCYERFTYRYYPLMLGYVTKTEVIDSSSGNVGKFCKLAYNSSNYDLYIAYYDTTNKLLKFARGEKSPHDNVSSVPPYYTFTTATIDSVGGTNFDCSLAADGITVYIVYYDSSGEGALRIAKSRDGGKSW